MPEHDPVATLLEALLEQTRAIRDVKVQVESLKQMMFEHRPAFVPSFEHQLGAVDSSGLLKQTDETIGRLESAIQHSRKP